MFHSTPPQKGHGGRINLKEGGLPLLGKALNKIPD